MAMFDRNADLALWAARPSITPDANRTHAARHRPENDRNFSFSTAFFLCRSNSSERKKLNCLAAGSAQALLPFVLCDRVGLLCILRLRPGQIRSVFAVGVGQRIRILDLPKFIISVDLTPSSSAKRKSKSSMLWLNKRLGQVRRTRRRPSINPGASARRLWPLIFQAIDLLVRGGHKAPIHSDPVQTRVALPAADPPDTPVEPHLP